MHSLSLLLRQIERVRTLPGAKSSLSLSPLDHCCKAMLHIDRALVQPGLLSPERIPTF